MDNTMSQQDSAFLLGILTRRAQAVQDAAYYRVRAETADDLSDVAQRDYRNLANGAAAVANLLWSLVVETLGYDEAVEALDRISAAHGIPSTEEATQRGIQEAMSPHVNGLPQAVVDAATRVSGIRVRSE